MNFINPVAILGLESMAPLAIDSSVVKKAKKKLQAEIELSDSSFFDYRGIRITRTDVERVANELEDPERVEFYHFLANYPELNNFLTTGDPAFFKNFRHESIFKLSSFIDFISPYYAEQFDRYLIKAFQTETYDTCQSILEIKPLVAARDFDKSYSSLITSIKDRIREVERMATSVTNGDSEYDQADIALAYDWASERLYGHMISLLPNHFQSVKNQAAQSLRNLSVSVFNTFDEVRTALELLEHGLELEPDGMTSQQLLEDHEKLRSIEEQQTKQKRNEPIVRKYTNILLKVKGYLEQMEKSSAISPADVVNKLNAEISVLELNKLEDDFIELRNHVALSLRAVAVGICNRYNTVDLALLLINKAGEIKCDKATLANIGEIRLQLQTRKNQLVSAQVSQQKDNASDNGCLILIGIAVFIGIAIYLINSNNNSSSYSPPTNTYTPQYTPSTSPSTADSPIKKSSEFKGNQLVNGISPFSGCFGKGTYGGSGTITFENSNNYDAVVCLVEISSGKTIRNEYIRKGSTFSMTNLPNGRYNVKGYYGNDWNPTIINFCGTHGAFDTDAHFSKSDNWNDAMEITGGEIWTVTLYTVANGNMSTESTTAEDYFKN